MQPTDPFKQSTSSKQRAMGGRVVTYGALTLLGTGALVMFNQTTPSRASLADWLMAEPPTLVAQQAPQSPLQRAGASNFIASAVDRVGPSVVRIDASRIVVQQFPPCL